MLAPQFMSADVLVCLGEGSDFVSFYCLRTGRTLTRGEMPESPLAFAVNPCSMATARLEDLGGGQDSSVEMSVATHLAVAGRRSRQFLSLTLDGEVDN